MQITDQNIAKETCIKLLSEKRQVKIRMTGNSMFPFIKNGETCIIQPIITNETIIRNGDVLLFRKNDRLIAHRLLKIKINNGKYHYLCKGDSCIRTDGLIDSENIIGKVIAIVKANKIKQINNLKRNLIIAKISIFLIPFYYLFWTLKKLIPKRNY